MSVCDNFFKYCHFGKQIISLKFIKTVLFTDIKCNFQCVTYKYLFVTMCYNYVHYVTIISLKSKTKQHCIH